jgi:hypothetical protein
MPLRSRLFSGNQRLEACLVSDPSHVLQGDQGLHVFLIHQALRLLSSADIARAELDAFAYGPTTADAVLGYKRRRNIVNRSYQTEPDNIVGKMTIRQLDDEMVLVETGLLRLGGAAIIFRGLALLASGKALAGGPQVVIVSEAKVQFSTWARQVVDFFTKNRTRIADVSIEGAVPPDAIAKVYDTAAGLAGTGGIVIINAGHGVPSETRNEDDGRFDLAPHQRFMIGGRNDVLVGANRPGIKMHTSVFYDEDPPGPTQSKKRDDETVNAGTAGAKQRLANWAAYDSICKSFKSHKLHGVVILTCRVGQSSGMMRKVAQQWGCPVVAYQRRVVGELTRDFVGKKLVKSRSRLFMQGDPPGSGTNVPLGEIFIPLAPDMVLFPPG